MGSLSPWHWAIIAVVVILLFGSKKLPDAARSLGKSLRIFKSEVRELQNEGKAQDAPPAAPAPVRSESIDAPATPAPASPAPATPASEQPHNDQSHTDARPA
jgi:sec-independent protein translocase protein TatA